MTDFETLLQTALFAYDTYRNSQTCSTETYLKQEEEAYASQYALINTIDENIASKQAQIDALMLEFCPERMTEEQLTNWEASQQPCTDAVYNDVCRKLGLPTK